MVRIRDVVADSGSGGRDEASFAHDSASHQQDALSHMTLNQARVLECLRKGDRHEARRLCVNSRIKEGNYKELCLASTNNRATLQLQVDLSKPSWPTLPKADETFIHRHSLQRTYEPAGHNAFSDMAAYERFLQKKKDARSKTDAAPSSDTGAQGLLRGGSGSGSGETAGEGRGGVAPPRSEGGGAAPTPGTSLANVWKEVVDQGVTEQGLRKLFDILDVSGDGVLEAKEVACLLGVDAAPYGIPTAHKDLSFAFKYCGGYANRYKDKKRLKASGMPPTLSDCVKEHKETAKHVEGYKPTAASHGVDRSMVAQGNHKGSGAPKGDDKIGTHLASEETAALDDERGSN